MPLTTAAQNSVYDNIFIEGGAWGATLYAALSTTEPAADGTGVTEPSDDGYARVDVSPGSDKWNSASSGEGTNKLLWDFGAAVSSYSYRYVCLFDASTAGNLLGWYDLGASVTVDAEVHAEVPVGEFTVDPS